MPGEQIYFSLPRVYRARLRRLAEGGHRGATSLSALVSTMVVEYIDRLDGPTAQPDQPYARAPTVAAPTRPAAPVEQLDTNPDRAARLNAGPARRVGRQVRPSTPDTDGPPPVVFTPPQEG